MSVSVPRRAFRLLALLLMRWSGLGLALAFAAFQMWVEVAVAMLVALAQVVAWRHRLPICWEAAVSAACMIAAVSSFLLLYERFPWWDNPVHVTVTGVLAVLVAHVVRRGAPSPRSIVVTGAVLAVVWELMESAGARWVDSSIYVAPADTALDIAAGVAGSAAAGLLWHRTGRAERRRGRPAR